MIKKTISELDYKHYMDYRALNIMSQNFIQSILALFFGFAICTPIHSQTSNESVISAHCRTESINNDVQLHISIEPADGWMNGGYGYLKFEFINTLSEPVNVDEISIEWVAKDEVYGNWTWTLDTELASESKKEIKQVAYMPENTQDLAGSTVPIARGTAQISVGKNKLSLPYSIEIPIATLPSPLIAKKGKYIELTLQETTWNKVNHPNKIIDYIDSFYLKFQELTGHRPYGGDVITLKESPPNPYFAYAGNPVVLNTQYVEASVSRFDNDEVDFGWMHELGHDFDDTIGEYYNYGTFIETQANLKMAYTLEQLCTESSKIKIKSWVDKESMLTGVAFNDEYFPPFGEDYLADTSRTWDTMTSDEYHALFHIVIRQNGWDVMKNYYRDFLKMARNDIKHPEGVDCLFLSLAVLDYNAKEDLIPLYKTWRIPLERAQLNEIQKEYGLK